MIPPPDSSTGAGARFGAGTSAAATNQTPPSAPSVGQSRVLMRSAAAIVSELLGAAFDAITTQVNESLAGKWDFDVGSPLVQRLLATKAGPLQTAFLDRLKVGQDAALDALLGGNATAAGASVGFSAESLSLLDSDDSKGETTAEKTARRLEGVVDEPMRDLGLVVGHLIGRAHLRAADNPFGPHLAVHALLQAAEDLNLHPEAWDYFLAAYERPLGAELIRVQYAVLDHFRSHGFEARAIRRAMSPRALGASAARLAGVDGRADHAPTDSAGAADGAAAGLSQAGAGTAGGATANAGAPGGLGGLGGLGAGINALNAPPQAVLDELLNRLQANARDYTLPPMPAAAPMHAPLLSAINELQHLGLQGIAGAMFAGTPAGSLNAWRGHLIGQANKTVDKLTIEIVGMLFDHILRDKQVPSEIKAVLSRMQFPVLKAALMDAAFFASSAHPARRLIDRIASASIGWEPYGEENERFRDEVDRIARDLLNKFESDVGIFEKLFNEFETFVADIKPRDSDPVARAKRALEEAEMREVLVINTTIQVRRAFDRVDLEPYLREFLIGPWVQVLVSASLRDDHTKGFSKNFRESIHDLVWSVQPKATADERRRLVELIPPMTRVLRDGMALIRMPERDQEDLLQKLMESHAMAVKPTDQATYIKHSLQSSELRSRIDGMQMTGGFPMTTVPGGIRISTGVLMRVAAEHQAELTVPDPVTDIPLERNEEVKLEQRMASWSRGTWFEIWDGAQYVKAQLRWISPLRTLFMFSASNGKAHVMSPELILSYLRHDYIRLLETTPLTKRAVDRVVAEFERSPQRAKELVDRYALPV